MKWYGSTSSVDSYAHDTRSLQESSSHCGLFPQKGLIVVKTFFAASILFAALHVIQIQGNVTAVIQGTLSSHEKKSISVRLYNSDYPHDSELAAASYPFLHVGLLAEPQRETTIEMSVDDALHGACSYSVYLIAGGGPWDDIPNVIAARDFNRSGNFTDSAQAGLRIGTVIFPSPGRYQSIVVCDSFDALSKTESSSEISVFYIRRELRKLNDRDRKAFIHCFVTMMNVDYSNGTKLYGTHYYPLKTFEIMHLEAAGTRNSDHFHDGMGLTTQHMAMSSTFELSMQSIIPHISLPYWDYTLDDYRMRAKSKFDGIRDEESSIFHLSKLFTEKWFGNTDGETHIITKGPFAYQEIPRSYNYSIRSAYGFLRAPWNINPNKYLSRYHKICGMKVDPTIGGGPSGLQWPTCASHFEFTNTDTYSDWYSWAYEIGYQPHGPVHSWIGGVGGQCETAWDELFERGLITMDHLRKLKFYAFVMLKNMWRYEVINTPKYCTPDTNASQCMWKCSKDHLTHKYVEWFFGKHFIGLQKSPKKNEIITRVLCETPFWPGDQLEAASPVDISFWPIHPTIERLLQYRLLVRPFTDNNWTTQKDATCIYTDTDCKGHNPFDLTNFKMTYFDTTNHTFKTRQLTNEEMRSVSSPLHGYAQAHIFAHFEWSHCDEMNFTFKEVNSSKVATTTSALG